MLEHRKNGLKRKIQEARFRLLNLYGEIAEPLRYITYVATNEVWRISTNGRYIYFSADWVNKLSEQELDFILSHVLMHILLGHINRPKYYYGDRYHMAADVVANGKLNVFGWNYDKLPHIGKIRYETFVPQKHGSQITSTEAIRYMPFDPGTMTPGKRRQMLVDSDEWWDKKNADAEAGEVVLSPKDEDPDDLKYDPGKFNGKYQYKRIIFAESFGDGGTHDKKQFDKKEQDDELPSPKSGNIEMVIRALRQEVKKYEIMDTDEVLQRKWGSIKVKSLDWKTLLHAFVQEEIPDYSFTPPDRRLYDLDIFLPDYNIYSKEVRNVFFMVDTSGSVSDEMLSLAYEEIKQALEQFNGALSGVIGFFDSCVQRTYQFSDIEDITRVKPVGGGGTDYRSIFEYINHYLVGVKLTSIVVITDGEGTYPDSVIANNVPVLWLLTEPNPAPWGKSVLLK